MSNKTRPSQYADPNGIIVEGFARTGILCEGPANPVNGRPGYETGALYVRRGGAVGNRLFVNNGTALSSSWAPLDAALSGVTAGGRVARGEVALDGSNPTPVATGLTTIVAAVATIKRTTAVSTGTAFVTVDFSGTDGTLNLYGWVAAGTASTGTETVEWVAFGT